MGLGSLPFALGLIGAGVGGGLEGRGKLVVLVSDAVRRAFKRDERFCSGDWMGLGTERGGSDGEEWERLTEEGRRALRRARSASSEEDIV